MNGYAIAAGAAAALFFLSRSSRASGAWVWPVIPNRGILSGFGAHRVNDAGGERLHAAVDIGAFAGDPIVAMGDGVVLHMVSGFGIYGQKPPAGYVPLQAVAIRHADADYIYAEIRVEVTPGQRVRAGERIGRADRNGDGNAMLHLEAWQHGKAPTGFVPWLPGSRPDGLLNVQERLP